MFHRYFPTFAAFASLREIFRFFRLRFAALGSLWLNLLSRLEFVFLERFEGRRAGAQGIVFGDPVEDMDTAVMEQGRL